MSLVHERKWYKEINIVMTRYFRAMSDTINDVLSSGVLPQKFQLARAAAIFKGGQENEAPIPTGIATYYYAENH